MTAELLFREEDHHRPARVPTVSALEMFTAGVSKASQGLLGLVLAVVFLVTTQDANAQPITATGRLISVIHDPRNLQGTSYEEFTIVRSDGSSVRVEANQLPDGERQRLSSLQGSTVTIQGTSVREASPGSALPLPSIRATRVTAIANLSGGPQGGPLAGAIPYAVVMCRFSDLPATPNTGAAVQRWLTGQYPSVDNFWRETSNNRISLSGTQVFGWFTMSKTFNYFYGTDWSTRFVNSYVRDLEFRDECLAAAGSAVNVSGFAGIAIQFNADVGTSYAYLGPITLTRDGGTRNFNLAFMSDWATQAGGVSVYSHEFGHNFGLSHSGSNYGNDYDSNWDVMSNSYARWDASLPSWVPTHTIGFHKDQLNWIPANQRLRFDTQVSGNVVLERSALPTGPNLLYAEIPILNEPGYSYSLEYRQRATAYEAGLPFDGLVIHKIDHAANRARVVDVDNNNNPNDAASVWTVGETFTDPAAGIAVSVVADLGQSLRVNVIPGMQLSVSGAGNGSGTVTSASGVSYAIQCSVSTAAVTGACLRFYHPAENVTLTAIASSGSQHTGWSGACTTGSATSCVLPMGQARNVTAVFSKATAPSQLGIVMQPSPTVVSGSPFAVQPIVELRDVANQPAFQAGVPVTVTKTAGNGTLTGTLVINTDAQGRAAFSNLVLTGTGAHVLTFTAPGMASANANAINVGSATATQLAVLTQPSGATSAIPFAVQPVIELRDASNQPVTVAGVAVTVSKLAGPGTLGGTLTATTNAQGRASFNNLVITGTGSHMLEFVINASVKVTSAAFTVAALPASQLAIVTQPGANATSGSALDVQPVVELRDANNQPVAQSGTTITVTRGTGTGTLGGNLSTTTNAQGRAVFTNLVITGAGAHTLIFSTTGLPAAQSAAVNVSSAVPTQVLYLTHPAGAISGRPFTVQPTVELRNISNEPVAQAGVVVTAAKGAGSGTLGGTLTATTNAQGQATFSNLQIVGAGAHTVIMSATGLGAASSVAFDVGTPVPAMLAVSVQPGGAESGAALSIQPVVELRDAENLPASVAGVVISVARGAGTGTLVGASTATTDALGRAVFTNLAISGIGSHSLVFSSSGLGTVNSLPINITAPVASRIVLATQPGGAVTGLPFADSPEVQLLTATGQPIAVGGIAVTVTRTNGVSVLSGTTTVVTGASGRALFADLVLTGAGVNRLTFSAAGLSSVTSNDIIVAARPQCAVTVAAGPGGNATSGTVGDCGRSVTVQANADQFYTFAGWSENGSVISTANPFTFSLAANRTLTATFAPVTCTLTLTAGSGGAVSVSSGSATGICGRQVTIAAAASSNFTFASWTEGAVSVSNANPYTFTLLSNRSLTASFNATQCAVTIGSSEGGTATVIAGSTTGQCGRQISVQATPNSGFTFANWTENGTATSNANPWTFTLSTPTTVLAAFAPIPINPQQMATRFASSLLSGTLDFTVSERQWIDTQGNRNDAVDLGDLVALLQKNPTVTVNAAILNAVLSSPRAMQLSQPVKDTVKK